MSMLCTYVRSNSTHRDRAFGGSNCRLSCRIKDSNSAGHRQRRQRVVSIRPLKVIYQMTVNGQQVKRLAMLALPHNSLSVIDGTRV